MIDNKSLKRDSWHHKVYSFYYHWTPTSNGCSYFWGWLLLLVLGIPGLLGAMFYSLVTEDYKKEHNWGMPPAIKAFAFPCMSLFLIVLAIGLGIGASYLSAYIAAFPMWWLAKLGWLVAIIIGIMLAFTGGIFIKESPVSTFAKDAARTIKEDWCPTIKWQ